jgi:hypothetical protein
MKQPIQQPGIVFTPEQQEQIRQYLAANEVVKAQAIILDQLRLNSPDEAAELIRVAMVAFNRALGGLVPCFIRIGEATKAWAGRFLEED